MLGTGRSMLYCGRLLVYSLRSSVARGMPWMRWMRRVPRDHNTWRGLSIRRRRYGSRKTGGGGWGAGLIGEGGSMLIWSFTVSQVFDSCFSGSALCPFHGAREGQATGERGGDTHTGWMCGFENPVCVLGVCYDLVVPFDLEMARGLFEQGRAGEGVYVDFGFGWHCHVVRARSEF